MSAATTAQWLTCAGIGTGGSTVVLGLLKLALDFDPPATSAPRLTTPPALPASSAAPAASAPVQSARHAGPPLVDETQPLIRYQPTRARHSKGPAWT